MLRAGSAALSNQRLEPCCASIGILARRQGSTTVVPYGPDSQKSVSSGEDPPPDAYRMRGDARARYALAVAPMVAPYATIIWWHQRLGYPQRNQSVRYEPP